MGKRELLIVAAFLVIGAVAWRLSAPAGTAGGRPFSLDTVAEILGNRNRSASGSAATATTRGQFAIAATVTELRVSGPAAVEVRGEEREDIGWTLVVEASAPDEVAARARAGSVSVRHDEVGPLTDVTAQTAGEPPRDITLTLQVPRRLRVRVESARRTSVTEVSSVRLENLVGDTRLRGIDGAIEGAQRNGSLAIEGAGEVALTLVGSTATMRGTRGPIRLNARNGSTRIEQPAGPVAVEASGQDLTIVEPAARVFASGIGAAIEIVFPRAPIDVEARRTRVALALDRAEAATMFVTEGEITLTMPHEAPVALDVAIDAGTIDASAIGLEAVEHDGRRSLTTRDQTGPRVSIRAERSSIVIVPGK